MNNVDVYTGDSLNEAEGDMYAYICIYIYIQAINMCSYTWRRDKYFVYV